VGAGAWWCTVVVKREDSGASVVRASHFVFCSREVSE
jgi:hypothetical protein